MSSIVHGVCIWIYIYIYIYIIYERPFKEENIFMSIFASTLVARIFVNDVNLA